MLTSLQVRWTDNHPMLMRCEDVYIATGVLGAENRLDIGMLRIYIDIPSRPTEKHLAGVDEADTYVSQCEHHSIHTRLPCEGWSRCTPRTAAAFTRKPAMTRALSM